MRYKWNQTIIWCLREKKKTHWNVKVSNKRDLFCSLFPSRYFEWFIPCWATVLETKPLFERHSVYLLSSKSSGSIVTLNEINFMFVWQSLSKMSVVDPHRGQIVFGVILKHTSKIIAETAATVGREKGCVLQCCFLCPIFRLYFDI